MRQSSLCRKQSSLCAFVSVTCLSFILQAFGQQQQVLATLNVRDKLANISLAKLPHGLLPAANAANKLASARASQAKKGVLKPFIFADMKVPHLVPFMLCSCTLLHFACRTSYPSGAQTALMIAPRSSALGSGSRRLTGAHAHARAQALPLAFTFCVGIHLRQKPMASGPSWHAWPTRTLCCA